MKPKLWVDGERWRGLIKVELKVDIEQIDVTSNLPRHVPNLDWRARDSSGHEHMFAFVGEQLPTLRLVRPDDPDAAGRWHCRACEAEVEPKFDIVPPRPGRQYVPGRVIWEVHVEMSTPIPRQLTVSTAHSVRLRDHGSGSWFGLAILKQVDIWPGRESLIFRGITELGQREVA